MLTKSNDNNKSADKLRKIISAGICVHFAWFTWSSMSLVCAADRQKRARASVMGVAGKPTTTTPILRSSISRAKALERVVANNTVTRLHSLKSVQNFRDENGPLENGCFAQFSAGFFFLLLNDMKFTQE